MRITVAPILSLLILPPLMRAAEIDIGGDFEVEVIRDVPYYDGEDAHPRKHKLDLYLPKGKRDFPVLFFVHGGGWTIGDRWNHGPVGRVFAKNGVGAVIVSYRLWPEVQHPKHIEDVARAFAWTHENIGEYGGRTDLTFVSGHSAGGHLAALLATNEKYLKAEGLSRENIKAVMPISGIYIFQQRAARWVIGKGEEVIDDASPLKQVTGKEPPFLIMYAERDLRGIDKMSRDFHAALLDEGVDSECMEIRDRGHLSIILRLVLGKADPSTQALLKFVAKHSELEKKPRDQG